MTAGRNGMLSMNKSTSRVTIFFIVAAVCLRFLPHPWNMSPLTALALFSGAFLTTRRGITILLLILFVSDLFLGFHSLIPVTWGSFLLVIGLGKALKGRLGPTSVILASLGGSIIFFLLTNLGVYLFTSLYPKTLAGLAACFTAAIPFFRNALLGDLIYTTALFGIYALALRRMVLAPVRH